MYATYIGKNWLHNTWATFDAACAVAYSLRAVGVRVTIRKV